MLDGASRPFLVMGVDLQAFLRERQRKRKHPLRIGEFFCTKCRCARKSLPEAIRLEFTGKRLGKQSWMVLIRGNCEVCRSSLIQFSSDRKIQVLRRQGFLGLTVPARKEQLLGSEDSPVTTEIERGE